MPFIKLQFRPGINRDTTNYTNEGGWWDCDKVRFRSGFPEKIGGWVKSTTESFKGVSRQLMSWVTSYSDNFLAVGTNLKVYIEAGGLFYDITPYRATFSSPDTDYCLTTTFGSEEVVVNIVGHGAIDGDYVDFSGALGFNGISADAINTSHRIELIDTDNFSIRVGELATASGDGAPFNSSLFFNVGGGGGTFGDFGLSYGSSILTVTDTSSAGQFNTGDSVTFSGFNGFYNLSPGAINGTRTITKISPTTYTVVMSSIFSPSGPNSYPSSNMTAAYTPPSAGTSIVANFEIQTGYESTTYGYGWGVGTWGRGQWGLGAPATATPISLQQRDWWFDKFDNDLVMNQRNGSGYYWARGTVSSPDISLSTRAVTLQSIATAGAFDPNDVPTKIGQLLVSQNDKHLLAFGAVPYGSTDPLDFDPLLIRWASQDEPGQWEPLVTNSAGFLRVSRGSKIVRALPTRQEILVWTDTNLYALQFLGTSDVFGLQEYADGISIASPRAVATAANATFWMGRDKFYVYTGRVDTLPCSVRNYVFSDIDFSQADQIVSGANEEWSEIWWFYPSESGGLNRNDRYVIYNYQDKIWYYGSLQRTAWLDAPNREHPVATNRGFTFDGEVASYIYNHELGVDDDGNAMAAFIESADFDLSDGDIFALTRRIIPDLQFVGSTTATPAVDMEIKTRNFPGGVLSSDDADKQRITKSAVGTYTKQVFVRARARQMALRIESDTAGVQWQLGSPRLDARPDGKR